MVPVTKKVKLDLRKKKKKQKKSEIGIGNESLEFKTVIFASLVNLTEK